MASRDRAFVGGTKAVEAEVSFGFFLWSKEGIIALAMPEHGKC
jgi:hypothetical protein